MVEILSETTDGYFKDGDGGVVAAELNHQENEKLVVVEDDEPVNGSNNKVWATVKPFVNGGLAGFLAYSQFYFSYFVSYHLAKVAGVPQIKHHRSTYHMRFRRMPSQLLVFAACTSIELGSFETLTRKVEATNKAMPLTLHQEVYCGLASAAITACICTPIYLARERMASDAIRSNILQDLYHTAKAKGILAFWKHGQRATNCIMAMSMGRLVSYNRSYNYFRESIGLDESGAILGAGAVSGFCAAACSTPILNVYATMKNMRPDVASGKYPYTGFLDCALRLWMSRGPRPLYAGFPRVIISTTPPIMAVWWYFEKIQKKNPMD